MRSASAAWRRALVSNDLTLETSCRDFRSCERRDDHGLSNTAERCGSGAADAGEVVAVGSSDPLDDAEIAEAANLPGEGVWRELVDEREERGTADAGEVAPRVL